LPFISPVFVIKFLSINDLMTFITVFLSAEEFRDKELIEGQHSDFSSDLKARIFKIEFSAKVRFF
jgi:hypothetical protein